MTNFNGFKGAAKPLEDVDLPRIGHEINVGEDELHAFMEAETRGSGFDSQGRPRILFERHKFYIYCPKAKLQAAIKAGLANKTAGGYGKESEQYGKLAKAIAIDEHAALMSCSWGLAQVMGFNHHLAGYDTVEEMVLDFMKDEENHLEAAVNFIKNAGADDELRRHDWKGFAKIYNGSGYAINKYDQKLAAGYAKWAKIKDTPWSPNDQRAAAKLPPLPDPDPVVAEEPVITEPEELIPSDKELYSGKYDKTVETVQKRLDDLGYHEVGTVDGEWGKRTAGAITTFQADNDLELNPKIDATLLAALMTAEPRVIDSERANATVSDLRQKGDKEIKQADQTQLAGYGAGGLALLSGGTKALDSVKGTSETARSIWDTLEPVQAFLLDNIWLILGGIGAFVAYKAWKLKNERLEKHQTGKDVSL